MIVYRMIELVSANDRQQHGLPNWLTLHMNPRYTVTVSSQCVMTFCIKVDQYMATCNLKCCSEICQVDLTYSYQGATKACNVDPKLSSFLKAIYQAVHIMAR